jgi:CRISPR type IV-associated protein Csf2
MKKKTRKAVFEGEITALEPIFHNTPDDEKGKKGKKKRCLKMTFLTETGPVEIPIISPNTIRAIIRDNIARDIVEKIGDGKLDYLTLLVLFSGGIIDKGSDVPAKKKFDAIRHLRENNIVVSLLGGAANTVIPGKTITSPCILICKETSENGYVSGYQSEMPAHLFLSKDGLSSVRREDMLNIDVAKYLTDAGMEELIERMKYKKPKKPKPGEELDVQEESEQEESEQEENGSNKRTGQMVYGIEDYVIAGSKFYHRIEIEFPKEEEIGAIYGALSRFAEKPTIGSYTSKGFGKVTAHYTLTVDDREDVDNLNIIQNGFMAQDVWGFWEKYKSYIDSVTIEKVLVPEALYKKAKGDSEDSEDEDSGKVSKKEKKEK